jgi:hypothetical protein
MYAAECGGGRRGKESDWFKPGVNSLRANQAPGSQKKLFRDCTKFAPFSQKQSGGFIRIFTLFYEGKQASSIW